MKALVAQRRHPLTAALMLILALLVTGAAYTVAAPSPAGASEGAAAGDSAKGRQLFQANCATCHGPNAEGTNAGPSLVGVGTAAVDFQVGTGRMPMQASSPQAPKKKVELTDQDRMDLASFVGSLGPGPQIPDAKHLAVLDDPEKIAEGGEIFRINCAMCHNVVGAGGALTRGKYAPPLAGVQANHIYEAMQTGPQSMPVFNDENITPERKQALISYLKHMEEKPSPGGLLSLGQLGPVSEGLFAWTVGMGLLIGCAVWLGAKAK